MSSSRPICRLDESDFVYMEEFPSLSSGSNLLRQDRVSSDFSHEVIFVIRQINIGLLIGILDDVSNPASLNFGQHLSKLDVDRLTSNPASRDAVLAFLISNNATIVSKSKNGEYITAKARLGVWERVFNTKFYNFHRTRRTGDVGSTVRAERYWIPRELENHVESVFNLVESLDGLQDRDSIAGNGEECSGSNRDKSSITKQLDESLNSDSSMNSSIGTEGRRSRPPSMKNSHASQKISKELFESIGHVPQDPCRCDGDCHSDEIRSPLQQNMISRSQESLSSYQYTESFYTDWLLEVADMSNPPLILSTGPWSDESSVTDGMRFAFTTQAIKLGVMGVSVLAYSDVTLRCPLLTEDNVFVSVPTFPSTNHYVTSVHSSSVRLSHYVKKDANFIVFIYDHYNKTITEDVFHHYRQ